MSRKDAKKILREKLFEQHIKEDSRDYIKKYPRTFHFSFSRALDNDDKLVPDEQVKESMVGEEVVITEKLDGENTTCYNDYFHPRSPTDDGHPSRDWIKAKHAEFKHKIPEGWRVCGENMYATHSIKYEELDDYFYVFSIWDDKNQCLDWDTTVEFCKEWGLTPAPVLHRGIFEIDEKTKQYTVGGVTLQKIFDEAETEGKEGIVCRIADEFDYSDFNIYVIKAVRAGHVKSDDDHWTKNWTRNKLKDD